MSITVAASALVGAAACERAEERAGGDLGKLLPVAAPSGYRAGPDRVNGALSAESAAHATIAPSAQLAALLKRYDYSGGYSRVWTRGDDFESAVVMRLARAGGAGALARLVEQATKDSPGGAAFDLPELPGVRMVSAPSRRSGQRASRLCLASLLVRTGLFVQLLRCGLAPTSVPDLIARTRSQLRLLPSS